METNLTKKEMKKFSLGIDTNRFFGIKLFIFFTILLIFLFVFFIPSINNSLLLLGGEKTDGYITNKEKKLRDEGEKFEISYFFLDTDGKEVRNNVKINLSLFKTLKNPLKIIFLPFNPNVSNIGANLQIHLILYNLVLSLIAFFAINLFIIRLIRNKIFGDKLDKLGEETTAEIIKKWNSVNNDNWRYYHFIIKFYNKYDNEEVWGRHISTTKQFFERYNEGDKVPVKFLPKSPNIFRIKFCEK